MPLYLCQSPCSMLITLPCVLQVLADLLTGKRVQLSMSESAYWRKIAGENSPGDMESGLQLVHKLFSHKVTPNTEDLQTVML